MIECDKCGANLTLDDEKCPYCNAINPDAIEHIRQLKLYQAKYATTEKRKKITGHNRFFLISRNVGHNDFQRNFNRITSRL